MVHAHMHLKDIENMATPSTSSLHLTYNVLGFISVFFRQNRILVVLVMVQYLTIPQNRLEYDFDSVFDCVII